MSEYDWQERGACRLLTPEQIDRWFFPSKGESCQPARLICAQCPVRAECLEAALANHEQWGVWGGKSPRQRRAIRRPVVVRCEGCGLEFHADRNGRKYCTNSCQLAAWRARAS